MLAKSALHAAVSDSGQGHSAFTTAVTTPACLSVVHCLKWAVVCRPVCLEGLLDIKAEHNAAKLVVGNTEVGIELKFKHAGYPVLVGTTHVPELNTIEVSQGLMHCCRLRKGLLVLQEPCWMNQAVPVSFPSRVCMLVGCIACACIGALATVAWLRSGV